MTSPFTLHLVLSLTTEAERTGSLPSAQLTGQETIYVSGCHLSPSSQTLPVQKSLLCVPAVKELMACRELGGDCR